MKNPFKSGAKKITADELNSAKKVIRQLADLVKVAEVIEAVGSAQLSESESVSNLSRMKSESELLVKSIDKSKSDLAKLKKDYKDLTKSRDSLNHAIDSLRADQETWKERNIQAENGFKQAEQNRKDSLVVLDNKIQASSNVLRDNEAKAKQVMIDAEAVMKKANSYEKSVADKKKELAAIEKQISEKKAKAKEYFGSLAKEV